MRAAAARAWTAACERFQERKLLSGGSGRKPQSSPPVPMISRRLSLGHGKPKSTPCARRPWRQREAAPLFSHSGFTLKSPAGAAPVLFLYISGALCRCAVCISLYVPHTKYNYIAYARAYSCLCLWGCPARAQRTPSSSGFPGLNQRLQGGAALLAHNAPASRLWREPPPTSTGRAR